MRSYLRYTITLLALILLLAPVLVSANPSDTDLTNAEKRVQKALKKMPYYSVFDNIEFEISNSTVTLTGKVWRAFLKSEAEAVILALEEVTQVNNQIEILPLSSRDDRLRVAAARAVFSNPFLSRYAAGARPSIHIIVERGKIILEGVVRNETDRNVAGIEARGVNGAFAVENNLRWEVS